MTTQTNQPITKKTHPGWTKMITEAINSLRMPGKASKIDVSEYIKTNYSAEKYQICVGSRFNSTLANNLKKFKYDAKNKQYQIKKTMQHKTNKKSKKNKAQIPPPKIHAVANIIVICGGNPDFNNTQITINVDLSVGSLFLQIAKSKEIKAKIEREMQKKYYPQTFSVYDWWNNKDNTLTVSVKLKHDVSAAGTQITCQYIRNSGKCAIFAKVKEDYEYTEEYLKHLNEFTHYKDIYDKELCQYMDDKKYDEECFKYLRLQKGGNRLDDRCHMKIYRHPPRNREIEITSKNKPFLMNKRRIPSMAKIKWSWSEKDGCLNVLIAEMQKNGFENDLIIPEDDTTTNNKIKNKKQYGILRIVDEKINHSRHKALGSPLNRGEMLAIILYTGCECNWYLSEYQRNKTINPNSNAIIKNKWQWMEYCLDSAICKLHIKECGEYKIYTGLRTTNLVEKKQRGIFKTFVSASWKRDVAIKYMNNDKKNNNGGMIIEMERKSRGGIVCADVSWISKFSDECEVLITRDTYMDLYVEDNQDSWQNVIGHAIPYEDAYI